MTTKTAPLTQTESPEESAARSAVFVENVSLIESQIKAAIDRSFAGASAMLEASAAIRELIAEARMIGVFDGMSWPNLTAAVQSTRERLAKQFGPSDNELHLNFNTASQLLSATTTGAASQALAEITRRRA